MDAGKVDALAHRQQIKVLLAFILQQGAFEQTAFFDHILHIEDHPVVEPHHEIEILQSQIRIDKTDLVSF